MCMVSMVIDQGTTIWPAPNRFPPHRPLTNEERVELEALRAWKRTLDAAKEVDTLTHQEDCEDPKKLPGLAEILKRLEALEKIHSKKK